jgi:hypothetical protein
MAVNVSVLFLVSEEGAGNVFLQLADMCHV